jgi:glycosyltransferase involved in cell wall biosynthesis
MRRVKVLHVVVGLERGGVEILLSQLLPGLDSSKYEITVCGLKKWGPVGDILSQKGIRVITLNGRNKFSFSIFFKLFRFVLKEKYDIIQSHLYLANLLTGFVLWGEKLLPVHKHTSFFIPAYHELGEWQKWPHILLSRFVSFRAIKVLCCSRAVQKKVASQLKIKVNDSLVIYNGIPIAEVPVLPNFQREKKEEYVVGTVGRLDDEVKGFSYLLEAISLLSREQSFKLMLKIAGEGRDKNFLKKRAKELGIETQVTFLGDQRNILELIASFDLLVLPSLSEGFGMVLLEAMVVSKPVVATRVGGIPEVVVEGETGLLVPARDPKALADAIFYIKTHPMEAQEMGRKGRKRVEECFSIDKTVAEYDRFYDEIIPYPAN